MPMNFNFEGLPANTAGALRNYIEQGVQPGGFLFAVLSNDLARSFGLADKDNLEALPKIIECLWWDVPADSWGSPEKVKAWISKNGLRVTRVHS